MKRLVLVWLLGMGLAMADPPPGFNVHAVVEHHGGTLWRGGAPRQDTLQALKRAGHAVTLIDLRHPANTDDKSGKEGRLSPQDEARLARQLGFRYVSISALDKNLPVVMDQALSRGDVYIHCMYGANRTGFAIGRYATADRVDVPRDGLGTRDWNEGTDFQQRLERPQDRQ